MGYGSIKNGKQTPITTFNNSWAHQEMQKHLEATELRAGYFAVRPKGALGTHGWINNRPWEVQYIKAASAEKAVETAALKRN